MASQIFDRTMASQIFDRMFFTTEGVIAVDQMISSTNKSFKVVVIGDASVGKSSLIHRITDGEFWKCAPTIGCNFRKYVAESTFGESVNLELWDTAGEERYQSIMSMYYRHVNAVIVVYDVTNPKSFLNVTRYWMEQIKIYCNDPLILLVGNKIDLVRTEFGIFDQTVQKWALENDITHVECSAKSDDGICEMITALVDGLLKHSEPVVASGTVRLDGYYGYGSYCRC